MRAPCTIENCDKPRIARGWCSKHYTRWAKTGDPLITPADLKVPRSAQCLIAECPYPANVKGANRGWCRRHYERWYHHGDPLGGREGYGFKGGTVNKRGYRILYMPDHPNATKDGKLPEHRLVMSQMLGRPLVEGETVHHRNGNPSDNRPENLELWNKTHPYGQRVEDKVLWAKEILALYGEDFQQPYLNLQEVA